MWLLFEISFQTFQNFFFSRLFAHFREPDAHLLHALYGVEGEFKLTDIRCELQAVYHLTLHAENQRILMRLALASDTVQLVAAKTNHKKTKTSLKK